MGWLEARLLDVDDPSSLSGRARARRWTEFRRRFRDIEEMRVIDLGGTPRSWQMAPVRPLEVICVNTDPGEAVAVDDPPVRSVVGDACDLPAGLRGERFDLVYSNSVLEHVGGHWRRAAFAESVRTLSQRHCVQTAYRYFPFEPHFPFPALQNLTVHAPAGVVRRWPFGHYGAVDRRDDHRRVGAGRRPPVGRRHGALLPRLRARARERAVAALTKSLIAVKSGVSRGAEG